MYITKDMIATYGYTEQYNKCRAMAKGDDDGKGLAHSAECRATIEARVKQDPVLKERLDAAEERKTRFLAWEVERNVGLARQEVMGENSGRSVRWSMSLPAPQCVTMWMFPWPTSLGARRALRAVLPPVRRSRNCLGATQKA